MKNLRNIVLSFPVAIQIGEDEEGRTVIDPSFISGDQVPINLAPSKQRVQELINRALLEEAVYQQFSSQNEISGSHDENGKEILFLYNPFSEYSHSYEVIRKDGKITFKKKE